MLLPGLLVRSGRNHAVCRVFRSPPGLDVTDRLGVVHDMPRYAFADRLPATTVGDPYVTQVLMHVHLVVDMGAGSFGREAWV